MDAARAAETRDRRRTRARPAARRAGRHQGHHRCRRPADHLPFEDPGRQRRRCGRGGDRRSCARPARSSWASCPRTNSPSAGRASTCRSRRRAIRGTRSIIRAARLPAPAPASAPGCSRWRWAPTPADRCAIRPRACGIVGLKPTYGLVSRRGVFPLSFTLDHVGPMTRTVADNALLLDAIAGHDPADPGSAADAARGISAACWIAACATCASASSGTSTNCDKPAHPEVTAAVEDAARVLQAEGAEVRTVTLPSLNEFAAVNRVILCSEAWSIHAPWLRSRPGDYGQLVAPAADAGRVHDRRRLCRRAAPAAADDRRGRGCVARLRRADVRQFDGPGEPDRGRRGDRAAPIRARRARRSTSPAIRRWR